MFCVSLVSLFKKVIFKNGCEGFAFGMCISQDIVALIYKFCPKYVGGELVQADTTWLFKNVFDRSMVRSCTVVYMMTLVEDIKQVVRDCRLDKCVGCERVVANV